MSEIKLGQKIQLHKAPIYSRYDSFKSNSIKTGIYYVWDLCIKNNRVRICSSQENVSKSGKVTGWINISEILKDDISVGTKLLVSGTITENPDGSGEYIITENNKLYINEILDKNEYVNFIAVSTLSNRNKIGYISESEILKILAED